MVGESRGALARLLLSQALLEDDAAFPLVVGWVSTPLLPQPGHKGGEEREIKLNWKRIKASVDYSNLNGFFSSLEDPSERGRSDGWV